MFYKGETEGAERVIYLPWATKSKNKPEWWEGKRQG